MDFVKEASEGSSPTSSSIQNRAHEGLNNRDADTVASTSNTAVETVDTESSTGNNSRKQKNWKSNPGRARLRLVSWATMRDAVAVWHRQRPLELFHY